MNIIRILNKDDGIWLMFNNSAINMSEKIPNNTIIYQDFSRWFEKLWKDNDLSSNDDDIIFNIEKMGMNIGLKCIKWFGRLYDTKISVNFSYIEDEEIRKQKIDEFIKLQKECLEYLQRRRSEDIFGHR